MLGRRTSQIGAITLLVALLTASSLLLAMPAGATDRPQWTYRTSLASGRPSLAALSCSAGGTCVVAGSEEEGSAVVEVSEDAGMTWLQPMALTSASRMDAVSCTASGWCAMVGSSNAGPPQMLASATPSLGWARVPPPSEASSLSQLSCWDVGACAVGGTILGRAEIWTTSDGGATWTGFHPRGHRAITAVACSSGGLCLAALATASGTSTMLRAAPPWASWTTVDLPATITAMSCGGPSDCLAVSTSGALATTDGGATWSSRHLPRRAGPASAVSCPTPTRCVVGAAAATLLTTSGGATWTKVAHATSTARTLASCATDLHCVAIAGSGGVGPIDDPVAWSPSVLPGVTSHLGDLACPSDSLCLGAGGDWRTGSMVRSTDGGRTWRSVVVPPGAEDLTSVACGSPSSCLALGVSPYGPVALGSSDAGATWVAAEVPGELTTTTGVACASADDCIVTGADGHRPAIATTHDGGTTWQRVVVGNRSVLLSAVSCSTALRCVAVGATQTSRAVIVATADGGTVWTNRSPGTLGPLHDVACTPDGRCQAVGMDGLATSIDGGTTWSTRSTAAEAARFLSVACTSDGACHAFGWTTTGDLAAAHPLAVLLPADGGDPVVESVLLPIGFLDTATCADRLGCLVTSEYGPGTMVLTDA